MNREVAKRKHPFLSSLNKRKTTEEISSELSLFPLTSFDASQVPTIGNEIYTSETNEWKAKKNTQQY